MVLSPFLCLRIFTQLVNPFILDGFETSVIDTDFSFGTFLYMNLVSLFFYVLYIRVPRFHPEMQGLNMVILGGQCVNSAHIGAVVGSAAARALVPGVIRRSRAVDLLRAARPARRPAAV